MRNNHNDKTLLKSDIREKIMADELLAASIGRKMGRSVQTIKRLCKTNHPSLTQVAIIGLLEGYLNTSDLTYTESINQGIKE